MRAVTQGQHLWPLPTPGVPRACGVQRLGAACVQMGEPSGPANTKWGLGQVRGGVQDSPGDQGARGAHPARARQEGLRVPGCQSCSSQSGLALQAGLGRQGALGDRGSLLGPGHGKTEWPLGATPRGDSTHPDQALQPPHGVHMCTEGAGQRPPGQRDTHSEALQVTAEPGPLHVDEGLRGKSPEACHQEPRPGPLAAHSALLDSHAPVSPAVTSSRERGCGRPPKGRGLRTATPTGSR